MAEDQEVAEKRAGAKSSPRALKRERISAAYGTTEVVPFPKPDWTRVFPKTVKSCSSLNPLESDFFEAANSCPSLFAAKFEFLSSL
jgi:hypothetical protein